MILGRGGLYSGSKDPNQATNAELLNSPARKVLIPPLKVVIRLHEALPTRYSGQICINYRLKAPIINNFGIKF